MAKKKRNALPVSNGTVWKETCHYGPKKVFAVKDVEVYGSTHLEMRSLVSEFDFLVRIDDGFYLHDSLTRGSLSVEKEMPSLILPSPPFIEIVWPDYGVPPLNYKWWADLAKYLLTKKGKVVVYCMGGHGRTGTALSILAYLMGAVKKGQDPVEFVRKVYCNKVVESEKQISYIERITGLTIDSIATWGFVSYTHHIQTDDGKPYGAKSAEDSAKVFEIDMTKLSPNEESIKAMLKKASPGSWVGPKPSMVSPPQSTVLPLGSLEKK